jgi:hypothetical protein
MTFTIGSKGYHVSLLAIALVAIGLLWFLTRGSTDAALENALAGAKQELAARPVWLKRMKVLQDSAQRAHAAAVKLAGDTTRLRHDRDSLFTLATSIIGAARTAPHMQEAARVLAQANQACVDLQANCERRAVQFQNEARQEHARADLATQRANTSDSSLKSVSGAASCYLLHVGPIHAFSCPSRMASARIGVVAGAVATLATVIHFHVHF